MSAECYPVSVLPHITRLFSDYLALADQPAASILRQLFASEPLGSDWFKRPVDIDKPGLLADALLAQAVSFGAAEAELANIEKLRHGARAVVTGQQVGLFGGPLLTLLKAATAVARAAEATQATGIDHVPVFWLATEDHDLAEVDQLALLSKTSLEKLTLGLTSQGGPVGSIPLGSAVEPLLDHLAELLSYAPISETLRACYTPGATLGQAFGKLMTRLFAAHGLVVLDAAGRAFHALGASTLRAAITDARPLESALLKRTAELEAAGYHAQVLVKPGHSLLFLLDPGTGERLALRHLADGSWKTASESFTEAALLAIVDSAPERLSPNAILRPVFQDTILPTAAYIGGPAEIAYFAQSAVLYEAILGHTTPVLPRFSATLIEPSIDTIMARHELTLKDVFEAATESDLAQRLGARAMPIAGKRRLAAVGNTLDAELTALTSYLESIDESLGRSASVSASKMRYQMNRLRRMAATFEVQKEASLARHAQAIMLHLFPDAHPQERVIGGVWFLAQAGEELINRLVAEAGNMCLGHGVVRV